jgi:hypothetical protein
MKKIKPDVIERGITWVDYPGSDVMEKKLNFMLFRHGKHGYCRLLGDLEGDELRAKLQELSRVNRERGALACRRRS